jgi:hypothetical protein
MEQIIAICVLVFWLGCGVYLYRVDPGNERRWSGTKLSFLITILLKSTGLTFLASALSIVVGAIILVALGVLK